MLNQDLFPNDPSLKYKFEINRLKEIISKFKKYDEDRTKFYEVKLKKLQELENLYSDSKTQMSRIKELTIAKEQLKKDNKKLKALVDLYNLEPNFKYSEISREYVLLYKENERLKNQIEFLRKSRDVLLDQLNGFI